MEQTQEFWRTLLGGNYLISLEDKPGATFVDANCLFEEYAIELAREFPSARVIGIGMGDNPPTQTPTNCTFIVANVALGTPIESNSCQFIQSRDVSLSLKEDNWQAYLTELYRILDNDGWIQILEMEVWREYPEGDGGGYIQWSEKLFPALATTKGVCVDNLHEKLLQWAENAGFTDISPIHYEIPVGLWEGTEFGLSLF
jgi:hypothetical protein